MNAPHFEATINLGHVLTVLSILAMGGTSFLFIWRVSADQATFQTRTELRLDEGEKVRLEKGPQLDAVSQTIGILNSRLDALSAAIVEVRDVNRDIVKEVTNLRIAIAGMKSNNSPEPFRP